MIEEKEGLTRNEFYQLIKNSPKEERCFLNNIKGDWYDFFDKYAIEKLGILDDAEPIYMGYLVKNHQGILQLWTLQNKNIKSHFSMFKICKKHIRSWIERNGILYATMSKEVNPKNSKWTSRLGFTLCGETEKFLIFKIGGEKCF